MDIQALLLNRERIQARLEATRAFSSAEGEEHHSWLLSLPLLPLAGFLAAKGLQRDRNPVTRGFFMGTARRLFMHLADNWGLHKWIEPNLLKKIFA